MYSFSTVPSLSIITLQQRIKAIKEKNYILSKKFKTSRFKENDGNLYDKHLCNEINCELLNEEEISAVENCYLKAIKLVEYSKKIKKENKKLSYKSEIVNRKQYSGERIKQLENIQFTTEGETSLKDSFNLQSKKSFVIKKRIKANVSQYSYKKNAEVISISDEDDNLQCSSELVEKNVQLENIQSSPDQNELFKNSFTFKDKVCFLKNINSKDTFQHCDEKDAEVIAISEEDDSLPSSSRSVKRNHKLKNIKFSSEVNNLLRNSFNIKDKECFSKNKRKQKDTFQNYTVKDSEVIAISDEDDYLPPSTKLVKRNYTISKHTDKNVVFPKSLNKNSILQTKKHKLDDSINSVAKKNNKEKKSLDKSKIKAALTFNKKASKEFDKVAQNSENVNSCDKVVTISDEICDNLDISNHAYDLIEKNVPKKSLKNLESEMLVNDNAQIPSFQNDFRMPVKELDLTKKPLELVQPKLDFKEVPVGVVPEIDLTKEPDEMIVPDLDLTEEPVNFTVPILHLDEILRDIPIDEIKSLKLEGVNIRTGRWSDDEIALLKRNFSDFQSQFGVNDARLLLGIGRQLPFFKHDCKKIKKFVKAKHFNIRLGKDIDRTLLHIYKKARLLFNPLIKKINKCNTSDIYSIIKLQKMYGNNWNLIGQKLGIQAERCCSIFLHYKKPFLTGAWDESEINNLISALKHVLKCPNLSSVNTATVSWGKVAELVPTRNSIQCYKKWKKIVKKMSFPV